MWWDFFVEYGWQIATAFFFLSFVATRLVSWRNNKNHQIKIDCLENDDLNFRNNLVERIALIYMYLNRGMPDRARSYMNKDLSCFLNIELGDFSKVARDQFNKEYPMPGPFGIDSALARAIVHLSNGRHVEGLEILEKHVMSTLIQDKEHRRRVEAAAKESVRLSRLEIELKDAQAKVKELEASQESETVPNDLSPIG